MNETTMKRLCHRHFNEVCDRLAEMRGLKIRDERSLVMLALDQQAPFFYVTPAYAVQRVYKLNANYSGTISRMRPQARRMWTDLYRLVMREVQRRGVSVTEAVERVLRDKRAPRFYLEPDTALRIRRGLRAKRRRCL